MIASNDTTSYWASIFGLASARFQLIVAEEIGERAAVLITIPTSRRSGMETYGELTLSCIHNEI